MSIELYVSSGVRLKLSPVNIQYLQEANPGDLAETTSVCITAEASPGFLLERSAIVTFELADSSDAGMYAVWYTIYSWIGMFSCDSEL